ncbi:uncharacterized protein LOC118434317 [Folsomia candida]|uniref:uncharacterized protein LOC118434317 n=1 Tax=Folsomia candida TaxID=158441 RepID=UPI001604BBAD|nr:uncharacterized protein LOC118434317 [Folsomia candida]
MVFERLYQDFKREISILLQAAIIVTTLDGTEAINAFKLAIRMLPIAVIGLIFIYLCVFQVIVNVSLMWNDSPFMRIQTGIIVDIIFIVVIPVIIYVFFSSRTIPNQDFHWYEKERISTGDQNPVTPILLKLFKQLFINMASVAEFRFQTNIMKGMFQIVKNW